MNRIIYALISYTKTYAKLKKFIFIKDYVFNTSFSSEYLRFRPFVLL